MVMRRSSQEIVAAVLSMDEQTLATFLAGLKPDTLDYLDILLTKSEKHARGIQKILDSK